MMNEHEYFVFTRRMQPQMKRKNVFLEIVFLFLIKI